ncbi:MAG: hypothetical protein ABIJ31_02960, partial [Pseudomonadota bacterium]
LFSVFDVLISVHRQPVNHLNIIKGESIMLTGDAYGKLTTVNDIRVTTDTPDLTLAFEETIFKGFWLGVQMWRAKLSAASTTHPGVYSMKIIFDDLSEIKPKYHQKLADRSTFTVTVYDSASALRNGELSLIKRYTGIPSWLIALSFFLMTVMAGGLIFQMSGEIDSKRAQQGVAEIYRIKKSAQGLEIFFGLGKVHGLQAGEKMHVLNETGHLITQMTVDQIGQEDSSAVVDILNIMPGCMVARINQYEWKPQGEAWTM